MTATWADPAVDWADGDVAWAGELPAADRDCVWIVSGSQSKWVTGGPQE